MSRIETHTLSSSKKICMILGTVFILLITILISLRIGSLDISIKELLEGMFLNRQSNNFLIIRDLRMPRVSTIQEIHDRNPEISKKELFKSGIHVGKDMMGTMSNTLILAFTGSSLNTMIMIYAYSYPYNQMINMYSIGIELLRGISGTIGIILAVPFVSLIGSLYLKPNK